MVFSSSLFNPFTPTSFFLFLSPSEYCEDEVSQIEVGFCVCPKILKLNFFYTIPIPDLEIHSFFPLSSRSICRSDEDMVEFDYDLRGEATRAGPDADKTPAYKRTLKTLLDRGENRETLEDYKEMVKEMYKN